MKIKLPLHVHIKLHELKITRQREISDIVLEALEDYIRRLLDDEDGS